MFHNSNKKGKRKSKFNMLRNILYLSQRLLKNKTQIVQAKHCLIKCSNNHTNRNYAQEAATNKKNEDEDDKQAHKLQHANPFAQAPQIEVDAVEDEERRLKVLQLELDMANQEGRRVPQLSFMKPQHWQHILALNTKSARNKYYSYLWQVEKKIEGKQRRKEERAIATADHKEELRKQREECEHIIYGLGHTTYLLRIYDSTINLWQNNKLIRAMQYAPKLVLDCGYDQHMTKRESLNAAKQLMLCFAENRMHKSPFDMHYCNADMNSACMQSLNRYIPTMQDPEFPMNVHDKCFTDLFPKNNLVYLTPHCRTELSTYNPDDVYIIGAMVDTVNNDPLSLARAKRMGLRMARLPLDKYLQWGAGSGKSLTLNQMVNILLDLCETGDWMHALRHVPRRKVIDEESEILHERKSMQRHVNKFNIRLDKILDYERERRNNVTVQQPQRKVRDHKAALQFNLDTWASKKT